MVILRNWAQFKNIPIFKLQILKIISSKFHRHISALLIWNVKYFFCHFFLFNETNIETCCRIMRQSQRNKVNFWRRNVMNLYHLGKPYPFSPSRPKLLFGRFVHAPGNGPGKFPNLRHWSCIAAEPFCPSCFPYWRVILLI